MFVHRVAGPSRVSMPHALVSARSKITKKANLGCFIIVQRHMSRARQNTGAGQAGWRKGEPADPEELKKQSEQMEKLGRRGQETKPIDDAEFPTLDVELVEGHKYSQELYFPYMPRRLRDWPIARKISPDAILLTLIEKVHPKSLKEATLALPSLPSRLIASFRDTKAMTRRVLALPPPNRPSAKHSRPQIAAVSSPQLATSKAVQDTPDNASTEVVSLKGSKPSVPVAVTPQPTSIFSGRYWHVFFRVLLRQINPSGTVLKMYKSYRSFYLRNFKGRWSWQYLDPGYWSSTRVREARLALWERIVKHMREAELHGKEARTEYMMKLNNDRMNFNAMRLIAEKNPSPEFQIPFFGTASRDFTRRRWWTLAEIKQRKWENKHFNDLSSRDSPLHDIIQLVKSKYIEMNQTVAEARAGSLRNYATKRYLGELEKRAKHVMLNSKKAHQTWKFERWAKDPECVSIRAKDFFADLRRSSHGGDYIVVNMLVKFDSWQSLTTVPKNEGPQSRYSDRRARKSVRTRRVVEYLVVDFRTWAWKGNLKFTQQVYPGQKLDVVTHDMDEEKLLERMREKKRKEEEEDGVFEETEAERMERGGKIAPTNS